MIITKCKEELLSKHRFTKIRDTDESTVYQKLFDDTTDSFIEITVYKDYRTINTELFCQNEDGTYDTIEL